MSWMLRGKATWHLDVFKAERQKAFWRTAQVVAMIYNTTRTESSQCKSPKHFFDQMTGDGPPPVEEDDEDWDEGSLAQAKAKRREAENGK